MSVFGRFATLFGIAISVLEGSVRGQVRASDHELIDCGRTDQSMLGYSLPSIGGHEASK
jgi:hypothetical protein